MSDTLEGLAASLKAAVAQSGTDAQFEDKTKGKREAKNQTPATVTVTTPVVTGAELLMPVRGFFNILAHLIDADPPAAIQTQEFANALAPVINKYAPAAGAYAPELALVGASAGIGWTMHVSKQRRAKERQAEQEALPLVME